MAKEKADNAKEIRCNKLLAALDKLQNKGMVGSYVKVYSSKTERNVTVKLDENGNLVLSVSREFFEPINMPFHFQNKEEKKDFDEIEKSYKSTKEFLKKMKWKYEEQVDYMDVNIKDLLGSKAKRLIRAYSFYINFGRRAGAAVFAVDEVFLKLFKLPKDYDVTPSLTIIEKPVK